MGGRGHEGRFPDASAQYSLPGLGLTGPLPPAPRRNAPEVGPQTAATPLGVRGVGAQFSRLETEAWGRNWDRGGGRVPRRFYKGRGRGCGSASERPTDGGGERRESQRLRNGETQTEKQRHNRGRETYTGKQREREERDWVRREGGETETVPKTNSV